MNLRSRLILFMGIFSIIATILIGGASYKLSERNAIREAKNKGELLFNYTVSVRKYFKDHQRPLIFELVEKNRFYPELMSGFVVTRGVWDVFKAEHNGFHFKQATIDPLYYENMADEHELKIINTFRERGDMPRQEGIVTRGDAEFYYLAYPVKIENKKCLRCHGDPNDAPKDQIEIYGTENGYNWKLGDTVSSYIIYVSIQQALLEAKRSAGILFLISLGSFLLVLLGVGLYMNRRIISPIEHLSDRTEEISQGKYLDESVQHPADDEIGVLARAIEHLRVTITQKGRKDDET